MNGVVPTDKFPPGYLGSTDSSRGAYSIKLIHQLRYALYSGALNHHLHFLVDGFKNCRFRLEG